MPETIRPVDDEALDLARQLICTSNYGALGTTEPETNAPMVTRIAFCAAPDGELISLVSMLSYHTKALIANPACSIMLGEPEDKGDPLTYPRITLQAKAGIIDHGTDEYQRLSKTYLDAYPKAKPYIGFTDFRFVKFTPEKAYLNGGFGKAFVLSSDDISKALNR